MLRRCPPKPWRRRNSPTRSLAGPQAPLRSRASLAVLAIIRGALPLGTPPQCYGDVRRSLGEGGTPLHAHSRGPRAPLRSRASLAALARNSSAPKPDDVVVLPPFAENEELAANRI